MKITPPMKPVVTSNDDYNNFDKEFTNEDVCDTPIEPVVKNANYEGFTFTGKKLDLSEARIQA